MSCVARLQAALAAVPVQQPCTAAAVGAASIAGADAAAEVAAPDRTQPAVLQAVEACRHQGVPGACMPVLAWLAAGLRKGLPPAATEEAHNLACSLLGVVCGVLPRILQVQMGAVPLPNPQVPAGAVRLLEQLGPAGGSTLHVMLIAHVLCTGAAALPCHVSTVAVFASRGQTPGKGGWWQKTASVTATEDGATAAACADVMCQQLAEVAAALVAATFPAA
jgi:hypothetical protein